MGIIKRLITGTTVAALAVSLTACGDDGPEPEPAAQKFAAALTALDISSVPFADTDGAQANKALADITAGMDPLAPEVTVAGVEISEENDGGATAQLQYNWDIEGPADWSYTSSVDMTRGEEDQWLFSWGPGVVVPEMQPGESLAMRSTPGERAEILGGGGEVLVTNRPVIRIGIDKGRIEAAQLADSAAALAELVGIDAGSYVSQVESAGEMAFVEALTVRDNADRTISDAEITDIDGARGIEDSMSLAPTREFARPILGTVGPATAEIIEASDGALEAGDVTGLSGLQQIHNEQLSGRPGITILAQPAEQSASGEGSGQDAGQEEQPAAEPRVLFETEPRPGEPLQTTLNADLQPLAEDVLAEEESATAIVAIRPSTGEILAAANGPGSNGYATGMLGQYPPGSTFKIATSLGLIRQGMTPQSTVSCTETVTVDGSQYQNAPTYPDSALGEIPLQQAIANSCNTAFISESDNLPQSELAAAAAALGIGAETDIGFPAFYGSVPAEADGTAHAAAMIGQGQVLVSPLALATMAASVAESDRVTPKLLADGPGSGSDGGSGDGPGSSASTAPAESGPGAGVEPVTAEEAAMLSEMMRAVVLEGGAFMLQDIPGEPVIAKTGTAEYGTETPPRTHAWMVAAQGDLAVSVFVEEGEYGSTSGGPLMEAFLSGAAGISGGQ